MAKTIFEELGGKDEWQGVLWSSIFVTLMTKKISF